MSFCFFQHDTAYGTYLRVKTGCFRTRDMCFCFSCKTAVRAICRTRVSVEVKFFTALEGGSHVPANGAGVVTRGIVAPIVHFRNGGTRRIITVVNIYTRFVVEVFIAIRVFIRINVLMFAIVYIICFKSNVFRYGIFTCKQGHTAVRRPTCEGLSVGCFKFTFRQYNRTAFYLDRFHRAYPFACGEGDEIIRKFLGGKVQRNQCTVFTCVYHACILTVYLCRGNAVLKGVTFRGG